MSEDDGFVLNLTDSGERRPAQSKGGGEAAKRHRHKSVRQGVDRRNPSSYSGSRVKAWKPVEQGAARADRGIIPRVPPLILQRPTNVLKGYSLDNADIGHNRISPGELRDGAQLERPPLQQTAPRLQKGPAQLVARRATPLEKAAERSDESLKGALQQGVEHSREQDGVNSFEEDLVAAVALSKRKDASLADLPPAEDEKAGASGRDQPSHEDNGPPGVRFVSFIDETRPMAAVMKAKRKKPNADVREPPAPKKRQRVYDQPKPGELVHIGGAELGQASAAGSSQANSFEALGLGTALANHLEVIGFAEPAPIQVAAVPSLVAGRDVVINAPTGSGKTLAYLAPMIADLSAQEPRLSRAEGTFGLVMVPTRELAIQVADLMGVLLRRFPYLVGGAIYGGENRSKEKARLRKGVTLLVATPGRLLDHLENTASFRTHDLRWLVLDEADRLLDLGFEQKIASILGYLDKASKEAGTRRRQTVLLSATMHAKIGELSALSLHNPNFVDCRKQAGSIMAAKGGDVGNGAVEGDMGNLPQGLVQRYVEVPTRLRLIGLLALLRWHLSRSPTAKLLIFVSSCDAVEFLHTLFTQVCEGDEAEESILDCDLWKIHGNLSQKQRTETFVRFSRCQRGALLCTDVAARGLDFPAVTASVQFDPPGEPAEYIHRIGRTARMGQAGEAVIFLMPSEQAYVHRLQEAGCNVTEQDLSSLLSCLPGEHIRGPKGAQSLETWPGVLALQQRLTRAVSEDAELRDLAAQAFRSSVRAYAAHPAKAKDIFHVKSLHLGHLAHSFALRETPTLLGKAASNKDLHRPTKTSRLGPRLSKPAKKKHR